MAKITSKRKYFLKKYRPTPITNSTKSIIPGVVGILATTNGNIGLAVKELYYCLNQLDDENNSPLWHTTTNSIDNNENDDDDDDIDRLILKERISLKNYKYISLSTKLKNTIFISSKDNCSESPNTIVYKLFTKLLKNKQDFSLKYCMRIIPISYSVYASDSSIVDTVRQMVNDYFTLLKHTTYSIIAKVSFNTNYGTTKLKELVSTTINTMPSNTYKLDYNNGKIYIWIQIIRNICMIGILENYDDFKKYNVRQLIEIKNCES